MIRPELPTSVYGFAGGGTGGHLFPGLAVAQALRLAQPAAEVWFLGTEKTWEGETVQRHGFQHLGLPAESLPTLRRNPWRFLSRNWAAYRAARRWIQSHQPQAVIGLGGFASAPLVYAAARLNVPILLLEQNALPGAATRWLARRAAAVCFSSPQSQRHFPRGVKLHLTGNPIRPEIAALAGSSENSPPEAVPLLLIVGGSQGAAAINAAVLQFLTAHPSALTGWEIVHQTGTAGLEQTRHGYVALGQPARVEPFLHDMADLYRRATVIIARAGATTLAEVACAGVPPILIPYPHAADQHQLHNAEAFVAAGAARLVPQGTPEETAQRLAIALLSLLQNPAERSELQRNLRGLSRPDAAQQVLRVLQEILAHPPRRAGDVSPLFLM